MEGGGHQCLRSEKLLSECQEFFKLCPPPGDLAATGQGATEFISRHNASQRPVALVTSGGTTVPLEKNTIRYLDNFSSGLRGSSSAEYFLAHGYAVIFLHRAASLKPYQRHFAKDNPLDWFTVGSSEDTEDDQQLKFTLPPAQQKKITEVLTKYQKVKEEDRLLMVSFTTVFEYMFHLRELSLLLDPIGSRAMIYLAAAVSDFYIHPSNMEEHKIQSSGSMELQFSHTPKMLHLLTSEWSPKAFTVTFKLETDETLLLPHAESALEKYHHQAVVANLLGKHRTAVTLVRREGERSKVENIAVSPGEVGRGLELEERVVSELVKSHVW